MLTKFHISSYCFVHRQSKSREPSAAGIDYIVLNRQLPSNHQSNEPSKPCQLQLSLAIGCRRSLGKIKTLATLDMYVKKSNIPSCRVATDQVKYFARSGLVGKLTFDFDCSHQTFENEQGGEPFDAASIYELLSMLHSNQYALQGDRTILTNGEKPQALSRREVYRHASRDYFPYSLDRLPPIRETGGLPGTR